MFFRVFPRAAPGRAGVQLADEHRRAGGLSEGLSAGVPPHRLRDAQLQVGTLGGQLRGREQGTGVVVKQRSVKVCISGPLCAFFFVRCSEMVCQTLYAPINLFDCFLIIF